MGILILRIGSLIEEDNSNAFDELLWKYVLVFNGRNYILFRYTTDIKILWSLVYFICNVKYYRFLFTLMQISILFLNVLGYEFSKSWKHLMDITCLLYWINTELIIIMHLLGFYCIDFTFIYLKFLYCNFLHMFISIYIKLSYLKKEIFYFHHAALYLNGWK